MLKKENKLPFVHLPYVLLCQLQNPLIKNEGIHYT